MPPIEWPEMAADGHLGPGSSRRLEGRPARRSPNSPALIGMRPRPALAPWPRTSKVRQWNPAAWRKTAIGQRPVARGLPAVDEDDARARRAATGRDEPGGQVQVARADGRRLERQAEVGRRDQRRLPARIAGAGAIDEREAVGEPERRERRARRGRLDGTVPMGLGDATRPGPVKRGRSAASQSGRRRSSWSRRRARRSLDRDRRRLRPARRSRNDVRPPARVARRERADDPATGRTAAVSARIGVDDRPPDGERIRSDRSHDVARPGQADATARQQRR